MLILRSFVNTQRPFSLLRKNLGSLDHNDAHATRDTRSATSSNATIEMKSHARTKKPERRDANAGEAIPRLPNHLVVTHVLRSEYFDDPADLARLPAVSRAMRDAVAATGLRFKEIHGCDAARLGCLSAVQRLQRGGRLSRQEYLCEAAARGGNLEELKPLRENGCPWDTNTCQGRQGWAPRGAAVVARERRTVGQVDMHGGGGGRAPRGAAVVACSGSALSEWTCMYAAKGGHLELLQWARANGCPWNEETCGAAAENGHLEVLQWVRANGCPWDWRTCAGAAEGGHLEVLQWMHVSGYSLYWRRVQTCSWAARAGHLEVLQWLCANGCPWDERTCALAAENGHLEVLQWARENSCPWDFYTCKYAAQGGHLELFQWARENGCPLDERTSAWAERYGLL